MKKLISCEFNMDTACVELRYTDGTLISIDCTEVEYEVAYTVKQRVVLDYGEYVDGAVKITKAAASGHTFIGNGTEPSGADLSCWVSFDSTSGIGMTLAGAAAYRTSGAAKAMPGFDVMDYGQEYYVFGSSTDDARHWNAHVLKVFGEHQDTLAELFD